MARKKVSRSTGEENSLLKDARYFSNRSIIHGRQGKFDLSVKDCNKAISLDPNYAEAYCNRAASHACAENYELAKKDFSKALKLKPNLQQARIGLSEVYSILGYRELCLSPDERPTEEAELIKENLSAAKRNFNKAIKLNPELAQAYYGLGAIYTKQNKISLAVENYHKANNLRPELYPLPTLRG